MPEPPSIEQKIQAEMAALGIPADLVKLISVKPDEAGKPVVTMDMKVEVAEELVKMLTIKLYAEDTSKDLGGVSVKLESATEGNLPTKLWIADERQKRSKPKTELPGFP